MTSIVLKSNVTLVDICSTRMLGQYGFLAKVFQVGAARRGSLGVLRACLGQAARANGAERGAAAP